MAPKYKAFVVPHTHWDRAWYVPFEEFRLRLVRLVDRVCDTLERDASFSKFSLDGQTVVLEDYLQIRPQMADRLKRLIRAGRLLVGPWYILPDEFLVSAESMVRNLMLGHRISAEFGHTMAVGYVPDPFGHVAQLPQILQGFGLDTFLFSRGLDLHTENGTKLEFTWCALDGTCVLALHQRFFYNNAAFLGYRIPWGDPEGMVLDRKLAVEKLEKAARSLADRTLARSLLLNNGVDHSEHQAELPALLKKAAKELPDYDFRIASFEDYAKSVRKDLQGARLARRTGELYYDFGDMLHGVYSARMYLKQANRRAQDLLEKEAEPLSALAWLTGSGPYAQDPLWYAWRELLKNHPHDDICGCSVDKVHRDMEHRFGVVEQVGEAVARDSIRAIARNLDNTGQEGIAFMVFNPLGTARDETLEIDLDLPAAGPYRLFDEEGNEVPCEALDRREVSWMECLKGYRVHRHTVRLRLALPPLGYRTVYAREGQPRTPKAGVRADDRGGENAWYKLAIADNGTLSIRDKKTGRRYADLLLFEDVEDCGDEYNWSPLAEGSVTLTTADSRPEVALLSSGPLSATWRIAHRLAIPRGLTEDRKARARQTVTLDIVSEVTCRADSPRVDIVTRLENRARDHRLRALFPTAVETDTVHVDGHYAVLERSVVMPEPRDGVPPYSTQHQGRFADLSDGEAGFAIVNDGMPEFEVVADGKRRILAQTLFRAVGWLSRNDLTTRVGHCGPPVEAPEGQCLRPLEFRYAFTAHEGDWRTVLPLALAHHVPVRVTGCDIHGGTDLAKVGIFDHDAYILAQPTRPVPREGTLPDRGSFVDLGNESLVLSTVKKCETRNSLIVRFYNPGNRSEKGKLTALRPIRAAYAVNLNEKRQGPADVKGGAVPYHCPAYRVMTFEVLF